VAFVSSWRNDFVAFVPSWPNAFVAFVPSWLIGVVPFVAQRVGTGAAGRANLVASIGTFGRTSVNS
jgi:hypothetical protein